MKAVMMILYVMPWVLLELIAICIAVLASVSVVWLITWIYTRRRKTK